MINQFIHQTTWDDLPVAVQRQARRCLLDTLGAAVGGRSTDLSRIIYEFAAAVFGGDGAQLWLDGRFVSAPGAALAHGMTIDALDIHDGYNLVKGHIGAAIVPTLFATCVGEIISGKELLTRLVIGYEVAARAGIVLHETTCDYHTSGAWNALGATAVAARHLRLTADQTRHALGIAEYHGPRSQMMRCIDYPTMVKDGSGWGAMAGVSAAMMAQGGFTGAPAITVEAEDVRRHWTDLGEKWYIMDQYFKPYAVCRWAQAAIAAVLAVRRQHDFALELVKSIRVHTFHEAVCLAVRRPANTEEAQYSLPFPVAAALVHNKLGAAELSGAALRDPLVLRLADSVELVEDEGYNGRFPAQRFARVEVVLTDGTVLQSDEHQPGWDADVPPTDEELREKFRWLAGELLEDRRVVAMETAVWQLSESPDVTSLVTLLAAPIDNG
ncbi:MAG: MmgE/PrpD family protein [Anaerolineales bacterium]|nr:MmgE/PrpD family protein [Anaerolineales bacterium]